MISDYSISIKFNKIKFFSAESSRSLIALIKSKLFKLNVFK